MTHFKTDRKLLNHNFQGYKLSSHLLGVIKRELARPVRVVELDNDKFSYQHTKAFALHNHLHFDPADSSSVYWFREDGDFMKARFQAPDSISLQCVLQLPPPVHDSKATNPTIIFLSDTVGVVCTGDSCNAHLFSRKIPTSEQSQESWSILDSFPVGDGLIPIMVASGVFSPPIADILFVMLSEPESHDPVVLYQWCRIEFKTSDGIQTQDMSVLCQFRSKSLALYSEFQNQSSRTGMELLFMSETTPLISTEVKEERRGGEEVSCHQPHPGLGYGSKEEKYEWTQSDSDVTVVLELPEDVKERDIVCTIENRMVAIGITDGTTLFRGRLCHVIDPDVTTWSIHKDGGKNRLEVTLEKQVEGVAWEYLTKEDPGSKVNTRDQDTDELTAEEMEDLKKRLAELTKDGKFGGEGFEMNGGEVTMMETEVEECDETDEEATMFIISQQGTLKQKVSLGGRQLVFTSPCPGRNSRYFSLRHDVDAVVWLPHSSSSSSSSSSSLPRWNHVATFNALGYVQASKTERKFSLCSPSAKFATISDSSHVFVYLQPPHSGNSNAATEYVHSMPRKTILGVVACDGGLVFVLTLNELIALVIPDS